MNSSFTFGQNPNLNFKGFWRNISWVWSHWRFDAARGQPRDARWLAGCPHGEHFQSHQKSSCQAPVYTPHAPGLCQTTESPVQRGTCLFGGIPIRWGPGLLHPHQDGIWSGPSPHPPFAQPAILLWEELQPLYFLIESNSKGTERGLNSPSFLCRVSTTDRMPLPSHGLLDCSSVRERLTRCKIGRWTVSTLHF